MYNTKNYMEQGGDKWVIGGTLEAKPGAVISGIGGGSYPAGGTTGQVLAKKTNADNDVEWVNQSGGGELPIIVFTINEETTAVTCNKTLEEIEELGNNFIITCNKNSYNENDDSHYLEFVEIDSWYEYFNEGNTISALYLSIMYRGDNYEIVYEEDGLTIREKHIG